MTISCCQMSDESKAVLQAIQSLAAIEQLDTQHEACDAIVVQIGNLVRITQIEQAQTCLDTFNRAVIRMEQAALLGWVEWARGNFQIERDLEAALNCYQKAHAAFTNAPRIRDATRVSIIIGGVISMMGRSEEAYEILQSASRYFANDADYFGRITLELNMALVSGQLGNLDQMRQHAVAAEQRARGYVGSKMQTPALFQVVQGLTNQAYAAIAMGQLETALGLLESAETIAVEFHFAILHGAILLNQARVNGYLGDLMAALRQVSKAQRIYAENALPYEQAIAKMEEGVIYRRLFLHKASCTALVEAADTLGDLGLIHESVEARLQAINNALQQQNRRFANTQLAIITEQLPQVSPTQQLFATALSAHPARLDDQAALMIGKKMIQQVESKLARQQTKVEHLQAQLWLAQITARLNHHADARQIAKQLVQSAHANHLADLEQQAHAVLADVSSEQDAIQHLRQAVSIAQRERQKMSAIELKARLSTGFEPIYRKLVGRLIDAEQLIDSVEALQEAKAAIWLDAYHQTRVPVRSSSYVKAREHVAALQDRLIEQPGSWDELARARAELAVALRYEQTSDNEPIAYPKLNQIQAKLSPNQIVVEYFVSADSIYATTITPTRVDQWINLASLRQVKRLLDRLMLLIQHLQSSRSTQERLAKTRLDPFDQLTELLYQAIIKPIAHRLAADAQILISPDDCLYAVPWAGLWSGSAYFGLQYEVGIVPAAATLVLDRTRQQDTRSTITALGHLPEQDNVDLPLHFERLRTKDTTLVSIPNASKSDLINHQHAQQLHIVAHGHIDQTHPILSSLQLTDAPFHLTDVLEMTLSNARLVTLAVCNSALRPVSGGIALAFGGAFLLAGAQAVIASNWSVDTAATMLFMHTFYHNSAQDNALLKASRQTYQQLRQTPFHHPFYWAAFTPMKYL